MFSSAARNVDEMQENLLTIQANGSIESITEWAIRSFSNPLVGEVDQSQKRAFEVIVASFLLTYLDEADLNLDKFGPTMHRSY